MTPQPDDSPTDIPTPTWRDASEVGPAAAREAWTEAARPVLVEAARRYRALVTLKDLGAAVQESSMIRTDRPLHQWIGDVLAGVAQHCQSRGEPLLTSLCVNVQRSVGDAYADAVESVRGVRPEDPDEHAANERLECYRHWEATGLPSDGGTALRTAHFTPVRKAAARKAAPRKAAPRKAAAPAAPRKVVTRETAAAAVAAPSAKSVTLCPTCFTQVPPSGVCDYCD